VACCCGRRLRVSGWQQWRCLGCGELWIFRAALVAVCRGLMIDRATLVARLQMQRRATVVAEPSARWIVAVAESAHPVAKIRGARSVAPGRWGWRVHAGIF